MKKIILSGFIMFLLLLLINCKNSNSPMMPDSAEIVTTEPVNSGGSTNPNVLDTTKILFIGNSLTYFNNMPDMVRQMAELTGKNVFIDEATLPGVALRHMVENVNIRNKINSNDWDYVILQSDDISAFPDMYQIEIDVLTIFKNRILNNNNETKIVYLMLWGLRNGVWVQELNGQMVFYSYLEYFQKIYDGTLFIANEMGMIISPAGLAWKAVRAEHPEIELFASDNAHPSYKGSFLCAAVHYSILFKESCAEIPFNGNLSGNEASILRSTASAIVLNNLELWNIGNPLGIK